MSKRWDSPPGIPGGFIDRDDGIPATKGPPSMTLTAHVQLKLFATLGRFLPASADHYPIDAGTTVQALLGDIGIPEEKAKLVFINGTKAGLSTELRGGERIGIFPPVGGG